MNCSSEILRLFSRRLIVCTEVFVFSGNILNKSWIDSTISHQPTYVYDRLVAALNKYIFIEVRTQKDSTTGIFSSLMTFWLVVLVLLSVTTLFSASIDPNWSGLICAL